MEHKQITDIPLDNGFTLRIRTCKSLNRTLDTTASCFKPDGNFEVFRMFEDFYKVVLRSKPARITAKAVQEQHSSVLDLQKDFIIEAAMLHYSKEK